MSRPTVSSAMATAIAGFAACVVTLLLLFGSQSSAATTPTVSGTTTSGTRGASGTGGTATNTNPGVTSTPSPGTSPVSTTPTQTTSGQSAPVSTSPAATGTGPASSPTTASISVNPVVVYGLTTIPASVYGGYDIGGNDYGNSPAVQSAGVAYNYALGTLAVHATFYGPVSSLVGFDLYLGVPDLECGESPDGPGTEGIDSLDLRYSPPLSGSGVGSAVVIGSEQQQIAASQAVAPNGLGVTWEVTSAPAWMKHLLLTCADIHQDIYAYATDSIVKFVIPLSVGEARTALADILKSDGLASHLPAEFAARATCVQVSATGVTCVAHGKENKLPTTITVTLSRKPENTTVYGSIVAKQGRHCGKRTCTSTIRQSASVKSIGL